MALKWWQLNLTSGDSEVDTAIKVKLRDHAKFVDSARAR